MARDRYGEEIEAPAAVAAPRAPQWERVPAGTSPGYCIRHTKPGGTCHAQVYWIQRPKMRKGKPVKGIARVPVDVNVAGGEPPSRELDGKGLSHYLTCPDAKRF